MTISLIGRGQMAQAVATQLTQHHYTYTQFHSENPVTTDQLQQHDSHIVIDCSLASAFLQNLPIFLQNQQKIIVVTTGWYNHLEQVTQQVTTAQGTLLYGDNFSISMQVYKKLLATAADLLNDHPQFDVFGMEHHHRHKKDAPAGTTHKIANLLLHHLTRKQHISFDRINTQISPDTLHIATLRGGENNIKHHFSFDSNSETIELQHQIKDRQALAQGVLQAVTFIDSASPGVYNFEDLIL
jgi:4-hydroxy-tetrahydrodipicolinate reductase